MVVMAVESDTTTRKKQLHLMHKLVFQPKYDSYALHAELIGVMSAIEIAHSKGWNNLWLEFDSKLVNLAFNSSHIVPWKLRNRWFNCLELAKTMLFRVIHIYREGDCCADKMAALDIDVDGFHWWENVPPSVQGDYISNLIEKVFNEAVTEPFS
ncbi:hypothetical protein TSUD_168600 [Trifolium subterraneum]|nr:hypothetical protein TSUD_168600 [Trifolium subterraneum]